MPGNSRYNRWLIPFLALALLGAFFLPWVQWEKFMIPGHAMPAGSFFAISAEHFGLDNPYPQLDILLKLFWLIPVAASAILILSVAGKKTTWLTGIAGVMALSLVTVYILFTKTLLLLGVGTSLLSSLSFGIYITVLASIGLILASIRKRPWFGLLLILIGPLAAWIGFGIIEKKIEKEEYDDSADVKSAYTVWAPELIREFRTNDSLANAKYREQILTVTGRVSATEVPNDSTLNIKIIDSTGSFVIFPLQSPYLEKAKLLQPGDSVVIRGSCSGGMYSQILETETITFKRCALIQTQ